MAIYPRYDEVPYLPGISITPKFLTLVSTLSGGTEKRRAKFTFPLYDLAIKYDLLTLALARTLWQFYKDRQGAFESFYFFLPYSDTYEGEYCGTGDASEVDFYVPGIVDAGESYAVYAGGTLQVEGGGSDYTKTNDGEGGSTKLTFAVAPTLGDHITIGFTGEYRFLVRFADDNLTFETFYQSLTKVGINLIGVR